MDNVIDFKYLARLILEAEAAEDIAALEADEELNAPLSPELEALKEELLGE